MAFFLYKAPPFNPEVGGMGRMLHYQTEEAVGNKELERLKGVMRKYNAPRRSSCERIKLWRKSDILKCLTPPDALWGFTRVRDELERELLLKTIREMSMSAPRLTWILCEENGKAGGSESIIRNGQIVGEINI
jgi:hypothetical protein